MTDTATSYKEHHFRTKWNNLLLQLTDVGCSRSENNFTSCCADEIFHSPYCHSGAYAGVICMQIVRM